MIFIGCDFCDFCDFSDSDDPEWTCSWDCNNCREYHQDAKIILQNEKLNDLEKLLSENQHLKNRLKTMKKRICKMICNHQNQYEEYWTDFGPIVKEKDELSENDVMSEYSD